MKKTFFTCFFVLGLAWAGFSDNPPPPFNPGDPSPIPVDGGVSLLLAAGAAYGIKKVRDKKKSKEQSEDSE